MIRSKRVTWRRADRALCAIVDLIECGDFDKYDKGSVRCLRRTLNEAANAAREVRDQLEAPAGKGY